MMAKATYRTLQEFEPDSKTMDTYFGPSPALFGQNWLRYIFLEVDWKTVHAVQLAKRRPKVNELIVQCKELVSEGHGKVEPFRVTLRVRPGACPRFCKPRPVPLAMKADIDTELDEMEASEAIVKVMHSDWAAPIVPIPKKNGTFRRPTSNSN